MMNVKKLIQGTMILGGLAFALQASPALAEMGAAGDLGGGAGAVGEAPSAPSKGLGSDEGASNDPAAGGSITGESQGSAAATGDTEESQGSAAITGGAEGESDQADGGLNAGASGTMEGEEEDAE